nr:M23 family metallopeptidase [Algiphilus aromaticivorans]
MLVDAQAREASRPEGRPVTSGYISSGYGRRTDPFTGRPASHYGLDFAARPGTDVSAVGSGIVESSGMRSGYGQMVEINHGNGYSTRYGHNSKLLVRAGERVTRGQVIAEVGASGRATGPHLHFEVWHNGKAVNPSKYVHAAR